MKKLVSVCLLSAVSVMGAHAAPMIGSQGAKEVSYIGARAELGFLNWENEYTLDGLVLGTDNYSFETVFGGNAFMGRSFGAFYRAEVEAGLIGQFSDKDEGIEFKMTVPYLMANGYYDFTNGLYVGAGLGLALPKTELNNDHFVSGDRSKRTVSPMFGLMFGWSHQLDAKMTLDFRYRLAGFWGHNQSRTFGEDVWAGGENISGKMLENDIGMVLDNSVSLGLRYNF